MRCRRVGANVSPMRGMLSLVLMLIKPALLSWPPVPHGLIATKSLALNLISKLISGFSCGHRCRAIVISPPLKLEVIYER